MKPQNYTRRALLDHIGAANFMGNCPACGKLLERHVVSGRKEGLTVGDSCICVGCGNFLVLTGIPYEVRLMTQDDWNKMDLPTKLVLARARDIIEMQKRDHSVRPLPK